MSKQELKTYRHAMNVIEGRPKRAFLHLTLGHLGGEHPRTRQTTATEAQKRRHAEGTNSYGEWESV